MVQTVLALAAAVFGGIKAWPEMKGSEYFSGGALLFYVLVLLVVVSVLMLIRTMRKSGVIGGSVPSAVPTELQFSAALTQAKDAKQELSPAGPEPDITLTVDDVSFYNYTLMSTNHKSGKHSECLFHTNLHAQERGQGNDGKH